VEKKTYSNSVLRMKKRKEGNPWVSGGLPAEKGGSIKANGKVHVYNDISQRIGKGGQKKGRTLKIGYGDK